MRIIFAILILLFTAPGAATSNGELTWTRITFCNGAGYCVKVETDQENELGTIAITRNGVEIPVPELGTIKGVPDLRFVRLVTLAEANGYANRLEIPFFGTPAKRLEIHIKDDKVDAFHVVEGPKMTSNNSFKPRPLRGRGNGRKIVPLPRPQTGPA